MNHIVGRFDNYSNLLSGLGIPSLDRTSTTFWNGQTRSRDGYAGFRNHQFSLYDLVDIYLSSGLAAKIVDRPAQDAFQRGVEIEGDDDNLMNDEYDRLSVMTTMTHAISWARLHGGSAILLVIRDGSNFDEPLNYDRIDTVEELQVLDITCIRRTDRYYTDPTQSNYGKLEYYQISLPGNETFEVHESRLIPVAGPPMPTSYYQQLTIPWIGKSALEPCINSISRLEQGLAWTLRLLERKQQGIYNMSGLGEMMVQGDSALAVNRINMVDQVRSMLNSIVVDKEDEYNVLNLGLDGLQPLINEYQVAVSADSNLPITILFGKSTTGLNSTGSGDLEAYYGMVQHIQASMAQPPLEQLTSILWLQAGLKNKIPDKWKVCFNALWVPTEQERATTENTDATANATNMTTLLALMNNGILDPEEVRKVVVNTRQYAEFDFPDTLPSSGQDINYAQALELQGQVDNAALPEEGADGPPP